MVQNNQSLIKFPQIDPNPCLPDFLKNGLVFWVETLLKVEELLKDLIRGSLVANY